MFDPTILLDLLWRNALLVIPLAILAIAIGSFAQCRPSTRHAMWVMVLLAFALPPVTPPSLLPSASVSEPIAAEIRHERADVAPIVQATPPPAQRSAPVTIPIQPTRSPERVASAWEPDRVIRADVVPIPPSIVRSDEPAMTTTPRAGAVSIPLPETAPATSRPASTANGVDLAPAWSVTVVDRLTVFGRTLVDEGVTWTREVGSTVGAIPPMPTPLWVLGTLTLAGIIAWRLQRSHALLRRATPAPVDVRILVEEAARRLGLRRAPPTCMVDARVPPMIMCAGRTRLVVPTPLWEQLDERGRLSVLLHELAHLRRRDHWVCRMTLLIGLVFWWHPVAWWMRRRLEEEADLCCDAWVTDAMPDVRAAYAQALLDTKTYLSGVHRPDHVLALGATSPGARRFARRLTMVMTEPIRPRLSIRGLALVTSMAAATWLVAPIGACPPESRKDAQQRAVETRPTSRPARAVRATPDRPDRPARPARPARPLRPDRPSTSPEDLTTFERYMNSRDDDSLEDRIRRLEQILQQLHDRLEGMGGQSAAPDARPEPPRDAPPRRRARAARDRDDCTPSQAAIISALVDEGRVQEAHEVANLAYARQLAAAERTLAIDPARQAAIALGTLAGPDDALIVRQYDIPEGRREAMNELMIRQDIPILVRPLDNGIEVHATEPHHQIFSAFVTMITAQDLVEDYALPEGKLEALTELMIRPDVPVMVEPRSESIAVHGDSLEQLIFGAFVDMIHPDESDAVTMNGQRADTIRELATLYESRAADAMRAHADHLAIARGQYDEAASLFGSLSSDDAESLLDAAQQQRDVLATTIENIQSQRDVLLDRSTAVATESDRVRDVLAELETRIAEHGVDANNVLLDRLSTMHDRLNTLQEEGSVLYRERERLSELPDRLAEELDRVTSRVDELQKRLEAYFQRLQEREDGVR